MISGMPIAEDYMISIIGQQMINNQEDEVALTAFGEYKKNGDKAVISYYEYDNDDPSIKKIVEIEIEPNRMIMTKRGGFAPSQLILEKGKRHLCYYATDLGNFMMGINTDSLDVEMHKDTMQASASYTIDVNSNIVSSNKLAFGLRLKKSCKD